MARRSTMATAIGAWLLTVPASTDAAPAPSPIPSTATTRAEPSAADKETARSLVMLGDEKMAAGDFQGALKAYRGADAIMGVPTTGIEVARAQIALGLLVEATDTLLRVSRFPTAPGEPEAFARARQAADELTETIPARIPTLLIEVYGIEPGTPFDVELDAIPVDHATVGLPRKVNPGEHRLVARSPGLAPVEATVLLREREHREVRLVFSAPSTSTSEPATSAAEAACYVGLAATTASVLVGAVTGGISLSLAGRSKDECSGDVCPSSVQDDVDRALALGHVATVSFIIAGAGALTTIIAGIVWAGEEPETASRATHVALEPLLGVGAIGLRGRF